MKAIEDGWNELTSNSARRSSSTSTRLRSAQVIGPQAAPPRYTLPGPLTVSLHAAA